MTIQRSITYHDYCSLTKTPATPCAKEKSGPAPKQEDTIAYLTSTDTHRRNEHLVSFTLSLGETRYDLTSTGASKRVTAGGAVSR